MSDKTSLHQRLDDLDVKISKALTHLEEKKLWNFGHHLSSGQLKARYAFLKEQIDHEAHDAEVHGHHVGNLERSVMEWVAGLEIHG
ncbi:MAG: 3-ketoacyl-ACP reductase [Pseudomonadota bacterium]